MWQSKWVALDKRSHVILTFGSYIKPLSHKVKPLSQKYYDFRLNSYRKMNISRFFQYKCICNQIWPCHKVGQGQARFIICENLIETTSPMLHTKSQGHLPFVPENKIFKGFFAIYGCDGLDLWNTFIAIVLLGLTYQVRIMTLASTVFKKTNFSKKFPFKCIRKQIWPWR